jgi:hypothetical protein
MDAGKSERPIFSVDGQEFGWPEISTAAAAWQEWQPFFEQTRQALAGLRSAAKAGQLPPEAEIRQAANAFRYAHNLISAEETNAWLHQWGMTVDDWMNYLRGQFLRERRAERLDKVAAADPVSDAEVAEVVKRYAVCSGKLQDWAVKLAGRAAIAATSDGCDFGKPGSAASPVDLIADIETAYERKRQQAVTPKRIESKIADHRLDWIRFDCRYVWFPERRVAREAAWCVLEDGLSLDEVAVDAHGVVQQWNFYLDEILPAARPQFLASRAGDCLGPIDMLEGFPLFSIAAKIMPAPDDPQICERAGRAIVTGFVTQAIHERVKWMA